MSPRAKPGSGGGGRPLSILQLHGRFAGSAKDAQVIRLMNHWGSRARHDILLAEPAADAARTGIDPAVPVQFLDRPAFGPQGGPGRFVALAQTMRDYDLVLSFGWEAIDGPVTQRLLGLLMGLPPLIHHEHGDGLTETGPLGLGSDFYRRYALPAAHALVVPSVQLAHVAIDRWHLPANRVKQIPDGIKVAAYGGERAPSEIPGLIADERLILGACVEDATPAMVDQLFAAVAPLRDRARLVVLDAPGEQAALASRAAALGVEDLLVPDAMPRPQDYLAALDLFVLLAQADPPPHVLVEAMAAGLPVVATDAGDVSAMVASRNRAFVVKAGDGAALANALHRLAADATQRATLGEANFQRAAQCFDEKVMLELYGRLYSSAVGRDDALT